MGIICVKVILNYDLGSLNTLSVGTTSSLTSRFIAKISIGMGTELPVTSERWGDKEEVGIARDVPRTTRENKGKFLAQRVTEEAMLAVVPSE